MFDIGFLELIFVFVIALLVIGPEKLPHAARVAGKYFGKVKAMINGIRVEVEREMRAEELKEKLLRELEEHGVADAKEQIEETFKHSSVSAEQFKASIEKDFNDDTDDNKTSDDKAS